MRVWEHTLTVDASVGNGNQLVGIGIVVQERSVSRRRGRVVDRITECHQGIRPGMAEEFAVLRALEHAKERGFSRVKIRSDYNQMRRALHEQHRRQSVPSGTGLRRRILELARSFEYVHFAWVPRRKNQQAHVLAREARRHSGTGSVRDAES